MSKKAYIFSQLFRDVRMNSGLSQWIVSVKAGTHLSNVNQIEAGHQEPRVHVAVRLVAACDVDLNSFFSKLTEEMKLCTSSERIAPYLFESLKEDMFSRTPEPHEVSGYGELLRYCRLQRGVSQKRIAKNIHYDLRSLQRVEKGEQEPLVTTAVKLVAAIDVPPGQFFEQLWFSLSFISLYRCIKNSIAIPKRISGAVEFRSDTTRRSGNFWNAPFAM